jgi:hypothetical protein
LPNALSEKEIVTIRRDCEILLQRVTSSPQGIRDLFKFATTGDLAAAQHTLETMKLTEADFEKERGGFIWVLVIIIILLATQKAR